MEKIDAEELMGCIRGSNYLYKAKKEKLIKWKFSFWIRIF